MATSARVAIVTGASSGMGEGLARDLVSRGWKVAMADLQRNEPLEQELGSHADFFECNVADYDSQAGMFQAVMNFKENIRINAVLPGIVPTKILPQAMIDAVAPECLTPVSTITAAYNMFLEDESLTGQAVECSADKHLFSHQPEFLDGAISKRAVTCWDPLFKMLHYEDSGLPEAIP
ncbi:hypothetical protein B0A49_02556 [Cryomyces minteri]|uniref:Uncharacterized protein n=1 Tax=Cryomyces minteri TaxID=331657 RepID=A0A4U0XFI5_9PEZI|nr:hypothetical protein B0A49_02556 [Cryomyces minteri]